MKRFIYNTYRDLVPDQVKQAIPACLKATLTKAAFALTRHPDMAFIHARHLVANGQSDKAAALYSNVRQNALSKNYSQKLDFSLARLQAEVGTIEFKDPLFDCFIGNGDRSENKQTSLGIFRIEFGYLGLKISGNVEFGKHARDTRTPEQIEILLDDTVLRKEKLKFVSGKAKFNFAVRRQALDLFPLSSSLSVRLGNGDYLHAISGGTHFKLRIPHGKSGIFERIKLTGPLDKKGYPRLTAEELKIKQDNYLNLYDRARDAFENELGRPLFILYGTLLGQHREGDFIPGDDDFDVGYVSELSHPEEIKAESIEIMEQLIGLGFTVILNRMGKPHRLRDDISGAEIHLDNRPVFTRNDGRVWMHKLARLDMNLDDFRHVVSEKIRGTTVYKPRGTEDFLEAYYGPEWRVPDPSFSHGSISVAPEVKQVLESICLSHSEQQALLSCIERRGLPGKFVPIALHSLYPLDEYERNVGR